jgi:uncharacterized protein (TIGR01244 family)
MADRIQFNHAITVGGQPSRDDLRQLADEGFKAIVNLRPKGEADQPLDPEVEADIVRALGLRYLNLPVTMDAIREDQVDAFRRQLIELPEPIYVHCRAGKRAGAFVMMHTAAEQHMSGDEALEKAKEMGFECDQPELASFVKNYVNNHKASESRP